MASVVGLRHYVLIENRFTLWFCLAKDNLFRHHSPVNIYCNVMLRQCSSSWRAAVIGRRRICSNYDNFTQHVLRRQLNERYTIRYWCSYRWEEQRQTWVASSRRPAAETRSATTAPLHLHTRSATCQIDLTVPWESSVYITVIRFLRFLSCCIKMTLCQVNFTSAMRIVTTKI